MKLTNWFLVAVAGAITTSAVAQPPAGGPPDMQGLMDSINKSCATDVKTLCPGKEGMDMMMCLSMNQDKLTPTCKDAVAKLPPPPGN